MGIKAKAKLKKGEVAVKVLMKHIMETGQRVDKKTGEKIPAHHISEFTCTWNDKEVFRCNMGPAVSKNPFVSFKIKGPEKGDKLQFASIDNTGETDKGKAKVK